MSSQSRIVILADAVKQKNAGFTLVELSIVLVVIGLVIGGVMAGRDMIKAATIRAQIAQIQNYQTAIKAFEDKYNTLPGDLPPAVVTKFGFETRTGADDHGNGDGMLTSCGLTLGCENALFWRDLSFSGMINESFTTATDAAVTAAVGSVGDYLPATKLKGNYIVVKYNDVLATGVVILSNLFHIAGYKSFAAGTESSSDYITPQEGLTLDLKMDDGKPLTGSVLGRPNTVPAAPAAGICVTNAAGNPYNTTTATYANTHACRMAFKF